MYYLKTSFHSISMFLKPKNKQKKVDACAEGRGACQYTCTDFNIQAGNLDASVSKGKKKFSYRDIAVYSIK